MARMYLNPVFTGISGSIGNMVVYTWRNRSYSRRYVVPRHPDTTAQRSNRDMFRVAMKSWQSLADDEKAAYNHKAARLPMTGHNLYISQYMRRNSAPEAVPAGQCPRGSLPGYCSREFPAVYSTIHSVASPSLQANRVPAASMELKLPPG